MHGKNGFFPRFATTRATAAPQPYISVVIMIAASALGGVLAALVGGRIPVPVSLLVLFGTTVVVLVPRYSLISAALTSYVVLPFTAIPTYPVVVNPAYTLILIWSIRTFLETTGRRSLTGETGEEGSRRLAIPLIVFLSWSLLVSLRASEIGSFAWVVAFAAPLSVLLFPRRAAADFRRVVPLFTLLSVLVAFYAILEFTLARNPIYDPINLANGLSYVGRWSVYRSQSTFGHPLYASTFFCVAFVMLFGRWLVTNSPRVAIYAVIVGLGLVTTVSRSALAAAAVGMLVSLVALGRLVGKGRKLAILIAGAVAAVVLVETVLGSRASTAEAASSADVRNVIVSVAWNASSAANHLGWGAALSQKAIEPFNPQRLVLENSYLQLLVSVGIPGLLLFLVFSLGVIRRLLRTGSGAAAGAWIAFLLSVGGYNALEALPTLSILATAIIGFGFSDPRSSGHPSAVRSNSQVPQPNKTNLVRSRG